MSEYRKYFSVVALAACVGLAGCGRDDTPSPTPTSEQPAAAAESTQPDPREAEVLAAEEYLALPRFAAADLQRGERVFLQCRACHSLAENEAHRPSGPNLWDMFGSEAAQREGFVYSDALKNSGVVWTPASLEEWLVRPSTFVPGNRMAFAGIRREEDRTHLIAYLLRATSTAGE